MIGWFKKRADDPAPVMDDRSFAAAVLLSDVGGFRCSFPEGTG
jgi:hypothetical protein